MKTKTLLMATVIGMLATAVVPANAQTAGRMAARATGATIAPNVVDNVKSALKKISASADTNAVFIQAVTVHDNDIVRTILIQNGASAGLLKQIPIDAAGPSKGIRKLDPNTIYFDVIPHTPNSPTPVGLVYLGPGIGWVDWNEFQNSWFWWW